MCDHEIFQEAVRKITPTLHVIFRQLLAAPSVKGNRLIPVGKLFRRQNYYPDGKAYGGNTERKIVARGNEFP